MPEHLPNAARRLLEIAQSLGWLPAAEYVFQRVRTKLIHDPTPYRLYSRLLDHALECRPYTSDVDVFRELLINQQYALVNDLSEADLIIDCGANVGFSTAYFLSRYPSAQVIAIEPDPGNFKQLQANVAAYGSRCRAIQAGVWSDSVGLVMSDEPYGDGREWARQVRVARPDETPTIKAVDIETLMRESGRPEISILKVDIERAEAAVFGANYQGWIDNVRNIIIELHDDECRRVFMQAIAGQPFVISEHAELTLCRSQAAPFSRSEG
ncbi:MAG: FkbM family methyltransferase [Anaerolineae bacterium]|nr:FkbM family methyltransferase [Anaerolineae bacterium]